MMLCGSVCVLPDISFIFGARVHVRVLLVISFGHRWLGFGALTIMAVIFAEMGPPAG